MDAVLAVLEQRDGALRKVSAEVVSAARRLADLAGHAGRVDALFIGGPGIECAVAGLGDAGADRVLVAGHESFARYAPDGYAATAAAQVRAGGIGGAEGPGGAGAYGAVLLAATATGKDLAPRIAARLDAPLLADVTDLAIEDGRIVATRPIYAGKVLQRVVVEAEPVVISIRPNVFSPAPAARAGTVCRVEPVLDCGRVIVREVKAAAEGVLDVAEAPVIVSGGRGLKGPENFHLIESLARALGGAAVGASRAVVDAGWRPHADQVGQTGKTVSPQLYIAVGISGAIQHLAGMRTSKVIVAINKDRDAPIFKVADYGVVGDLFEVVPRLTEEIRKVRAG